MRKESPCALRRDEAISFCIPPDRSLISRERSSIWDFVCSDSWEILVSRFESCRRVFSIARRLTDKTARVAQRRMKGAEYARKRKPAGRLGFFTRTSARGLVRLCSSSYFFHLLGRLFQIEPAKTTDCFMEAIISQARKNSNETGAGATAFATRGRATLQGHPRVARIAVGFPYFWAAFSAVNLFSTSESPRLDRYASRLPMAFRGSSRLFW